MVRDSVKRTVPYVVAAVVLHLVLIQPNHPAAMTWQALWMFPLELPILLLALPVLGDGRLGRVLRVVLVLVLTTIATFKAADLAMFTAFTRGFNPVGDLPLIAAGFRLLWGSIGLVAAIAAIVAALLAIALLAAVLWWSMTVWARLVLPRPARIIASGGAVAALVLAVMDVGAIMARWNVPVQTPGAAFTARVGLERAVLVQRTLADLRAFNDLARADPFAGRTNLLDAIDRNVLVVFVESYGRTSLDTPFYADAHRPLLQAAGQSLEAQGLAMRSAYLTSPTRGGQSWLAHATFANGMRVDGQARYHAALASGRETLFHLAGNAGFHTAAVMPAITLDWPEALLMGFETVLPAEDLGYAGLPFNWVTMPDQYTLAATDRLLRDGADERRLFAQIALISSHAPWVPVPDLVAWVAIGDGTIYNEVAQSGDRPDVVWRDQDRVRAQYRKAVGYSLDSVFAYAALHADEPPLMIVLGDHQTSGYIALDDRTDVPVHLIGPPELIARIDDWGWAEGLVPADDGPVLPMEAMRDMLLNSYSSAPPLGTALQSPVIPHEG